VEQQQRQQAEAAAKAKAAADAKTKAEQEAHRFAMEAEPKPVAPKSTQPASDVSAADAARYLARGRAMIVQGDIIGARLFFERAAQGGLAQGALALGDTYNANTLRQLGVVGVAPDKTSARKWYQTALDLGAPEAKQRMETLDGR
jgi:TPR repeat protein